MKALPEPVTGLEVTDEVVPELVALLQSARQVLPEPEAVQEITA